MGFRKNFTNGMYSIQTLKNYESFRKNLNNKSVFYDVLVGIMDMANIFEKSLCFTCISGKLEDDPLSISEKVYWCGYRKRHIRELPMKKGDCNKHISQDTQRRLGKNGEVR